VSEAQQRVGVGRHRAADVEQEHQAARLVTSVVVHQASRLAAVAQHGAHGSADVDALPTAGATAQGAPAPHPGRQQGDHPVDLVALEAVQGGDVAVAQHLGGGGRNRQRVVPGGHVDVFR